jgi:hypothetical protein
MLLQPLLRRKARTVDISIEGGVRGAHEVRHAGARLSIRNMKSADEKSGAQQTARQASGTE